MLCWYVMNLFQLKHHLLAAIETYQIQKSLSQSQQDPQIWFYKYQINLCQELPNKPYHNSAHVVQAKQGREFPKTKCLFSS